MSQPTGREVINLYRGLIRYSKKLKYTDKDYFLSRIEDEFRKNQQLDKPEVVEFCYKVNIEIFWASKTMTYVSMS